MDVAGVRSHVTASASRLAEQRSIVGDAALSQVVPSESVDNDDRVMRGACFASYRTVSVSLVWTRSHDRSHMRGSSSVISLAVSSGARR